MPDFFHLGWPGYLNIPSELVTKIMETLIRENDASIRSLSHHDYIIAWISALPAEMAVAEPMLD
jgi:hypothetical protein